MRPFPVQILAFVFLSLFHGCLCAPTSTSFSPTPALATSTVTTHRPHATSHRTRSHSLHILSTNAIAHIPPPTDTGKRPHSSSPPDAGQGESSSGQRPIVIAFEVLGALGAIALIFSFTRCLISYRKTPRPSRIQAYIHRHQLQREMEEIENTLPHRSSLIGPPPPPYFPRPPSYTGHDSPPSSPVRSSYVQVDLASPPPSPTRSRSQHAVPTHSPSSSFG